MRLLVVATVLAATFAGSSAFAQGDYRHHAFCLLTGPARECAYDTLQQCQAAERGSADSCMPNSPPQHH